MTQITQTMLGALSDKVETLHHCHVKEERAWMFTSEDTQTTEHEYLNLLHALVYCLKPLSVLETGTFKGYGTTAMAKALKRNGVGRIVGVEIEMKAAMWAGEMLRVNGVADWADIVVSDSIHYLSTTGRIFDFALFDSQIPLRCKELKICLERGLLRSGSMACLHDTSRLRTTTPGEPDQQAKAHWDEFLSIPGIRFVEFPLSRGLTLLQVE
jgi:predicted O-methyltransferase YrrM